MLMLKSPDMVPDKNEACFRALWSFRCAGNVYSHSRTPEPYKKFIKGLIPDTRENIPLPTPEAGDKDLPEQDQKAKKAAEKFKNMPPLDNEELTPYTYAEINALVIMILVGFRFALKSTPSTSIERKSIRHD